ncbi:hypothetical protein H7271_06405 [Bittarella massiliensis]|uniref:hypothetical protein n=1 Tax=Bittarella massiliensis (ex Durand et al. 2017) TaxID=1720313 RepID=UPI00163CA5E0|nr:hypothetical protein [Bittarella massiliensis (ex Durand et al. 2017)]MBC2871234.1 hypothetical protein [Bittarella massiliensis (ex Durand et al. 2017)]
MKVYELMNEIDNMPAGAEVRFRRKLVEDELNKANDGLYVVDLPIRWAEMEEDVVLLDGWKS